MDWFSFPPSMIWPLAACLVLTGIHVYLGVHVIARKVIFVDLALAQIAALGTVIGVLMGYEVTKDATTLYLYSLAFTIFGAFIFSITKMKGEHVPHEAIIGIVYAVTFAATILVLSRSALGPQELDHIIKGELLWVQGPTVLKTAIIYSLVGLFHVVFRKQFMALSFKGEGENGLRNPRWWDFLFYMSFGFVITSSVAIAGVFLVFSYLVIPSVGAMLLTSKLSTRLIIGWTAGAIISFLGVKLSYDTGLPTSPLVVVLLAGALLLSAIVRYLRRAESTWRAVRNLALYFGVMALFAGGVWIARKPQEDELAHALHMLESRISTDRLGGLMIFREHPDRTSDWKEPARHALGDDDAEVRKAAVELLTGLDDGAPLADIMPLLRDPSDRVKRAVIVAVDKHGTPGDLEALVAASSSEEDVELRLSMLKAGIEHGIPASLVQLATIVREGGLFAGDAFDLLRGHLESGLSLGNQASLARWVSEHHQELRWNANGHVFTYPGLRAHP